MKKILLFGLGFIFSALAFAQENLAHDQNPRYALSMVKYTGNAEQLQSTNNTTVHDTYKAFDWYESKKEQKRNRVEFRRTLRLIEAQNNSRYNRWNRPSRYNNYRNYNNYNNWEYDNNFDLWPF